MTPPTPSTSDRARPDVAAAVPSPGIAAEPHAAPATGDACRLAAGQLDATLGQLDELVGRLAAEDYATPLEGIFGGSIGGHVRHCLDHVRVLVETMERAREDGAAPAASTAAGSASPAVAPADYDARVRGTAVETDPAAARSLLGDLRRRLEAAAADVPLDRPAALSVMLSGDGLRVPMHSTVGREIGFVFSHTIHHQAMIGGMARHLGVDVPRSFGRAPSTIAHDESRACAR